MAFAKAGFDPGQLPKGLRRRATISLPERVATARDLWQRRLIELQHGPSVIRERLPAAVISPESSGEVADLVAFARREGLPLVPFGAGSGVCGGIECDERTLVVDTKRLRRAVPDGERLILNVGTGALGLTLEEALARRGLTIGHFPSSILCSTVGGWVAARGAGQCSGRYGKIEDMVVSAECVLGTGELVRFSRRSGDIDLLPLLIGSEGALGILTELELRLHPAPVERAFSAFELGDLASGARALRAVYQAGLRPAVARLYDPLDSLLLGDSTRAPPHEPVENAGPGARVTPLLGSLLVAPRLLNLAVAAAEHTFAGRVKLLFVLEGASGEARADAEELTRLVEAEGGRALGEGLARAWYEHRYRVSYRQSNVFCSGAWSDTMEVAAPWSRLLEVFRAVRRALGRHALVLAHMSHAYPDGCSIYFTFLGRSRSRRAERQHRAAWRDALGAALDAGAVISHHHGVGRLRAAALAAELGPGGVEALHALKRAWDPDGILNPGSALCPGARPQIRSRVESSSSPGMELDAEAKIARFSGDTPLPAAEAELRARGHTLGLASTPEMTVAEWLASGLPGARDPWLDPVEQRVAGLEGVLESGAVVSIRPAPRRATGPDLGALFIGAGQRLGRVRAAWLRIHEVGARAARPLAFFAERAPSVSPGETQAFEALARELT